jgi:hypothetical protein
MRAEDLPLLVVDEGQNLGDEFLAIVAEEFVMGHPCLLTQGVNREILEPGTDEHNMVLAHATSRFWMVIPHPYYTVTDESGKFEFTDGPLGTYQIVAY